jgi:hypothetical protein
MVDTTKCTLDPKDSLFAHSWSRVIALEPHVETVLVEAEIKTRHLYLTKHENVENIRSRIRLVFGINKLEINEWTKLSNKYKQIQ